MTLGIYHAAFLHHLLKRNRAKEMRYLEAWSLRRSCEDLVGAFNKSGLDNLVLSAEGFSMLGDSLNYRKLRRLLRGHDITIVAYVRRLDDWHESMFQQEQLGWYETRANEGAGGYLAKNVNFSFFNKLNDFANALPEARLVIRSMDDVRSRGEDLLIDFLDSIGLSDRNGRTLQRLATEFKPTNASLSWPQFQLISFIRSNTQDPELISALRQSINRFNAKKRAVGPRWLTFHRDARRDFLARYANDVTELNQAFGTAIKAPNAIREGKDAPSEVTQNMRLEWFDEISDLIRNSDHREQITKLLQADA